MELIYLLLTASTDVTQTQSGDPLIYEQKKKFPNPAHMHHILYQILLSGSS